MGATNFMCVGGGMSAQEAFQDAREYALHENGHGGYTGTVAEKSSFRIVECSDLSEDGIVNLCKTIMDDESHWAQEKYGPAACIEIVKPEGKHTGRYLFFGMASE